MSVFRYPGAMSMSVVRQSSTEVAAGAHAILVVDQAGWHASSKFDVLKNITIVPLRPRSPELNPVENIWRFIRQNWLSNRVFRPYEDIVAHCCENWRKLIGQPWRIRSIERRKWAHGFRFMSAGIKCN